MRKFSAKQKIAAGLGAGAMVVAGAGAAVAFWSTTGNGSGNATAASANGAVTYDVSVTGGIAPGLTEPVTYAAHNTGTTSLQINNPTATVSIDSTHATAGCLASWFSVAQPTQGTTTIPAGTTAASPVSLGGGNLNFPDLSTTDQNACKGATITVTVASS